MADRAIPTPLLAVIGVCVVIEGVLLLSDYGLIANGRLRADVCLQAAFWTGLLHDTRPNYALQPYLMFVTYAFLHGGVLHLAVNMFTLFSLGRVVCQQVGTRGFIALYCVSVLGGGAGFALLTNTPAPMVGASGALFGLAGAILAWNTRDLRTAQQSLWPVWRALLGLLILNLLFWWATSGLLAWQTHLGGFVAGWLLAFVIVPEREVWAD